MYQHRRHQMAFLVPVILALAACGPAAAPTSPPEPREAVIQALRSTAGLGAAHALLNLEYRDGAGQITVITIEGDVDVAARELDVTATTDPDLLGSDSARLVVVDGSIYSQLGTGPWSVSGGPGQDPLEVVPTTARIAEAVEAAIRDPTTVITTTGSEACGDATCLRIRAEASPAVAWRALEAMLSREGQPVESTMPASFPGIAVELWIDAATLRLRQATNMTQVDGQSISITVALSRHDEPVTIVAPPVP